MHKLKGFTVIELLVVFSIITLLSSVILVNLKNTKDTSKISNLIESNAHTKHALAAEAVGYWDFNEASGTTVKDFSGRHDGSLSAEAMRSSDIASVYLYKSLSFNGTTDRVTLTNPVTIPATTTVSMWVKTSSTADGSFFSNTTGGGTFRIGILTQGQNVGRFWVNDTGISLNSKRTLYSNASIVDGRWHHVAFTTNGSLSILYIDGKEDIRDTRNTVTSTGTGYFGFEGPNTFFSGNLDDVAIYTQALIASDINKIYLAGLAEHSNLASK